MSDGQYKSLWTRFLEWLFASGPDYSADQGRVGAFPKHEFTFALRLDSSLQGLRFHAEFDASYRCADDYQAKARARSAVSRLVHDAAQEITRRYSLIEAGNAQLEVNERLLELSSLPAAERPWGVVALTASEQDLAEARMFESAAREVTRLRALRRDVFSDPVMARLWWLIRYPEKIDHFPQTRAVLDEIVALSVQPRLDRNGDRSAVQVAHLYSELLNGMAPESRQHVVERSMDHLAHVFDVCQRPDLATRLGEARYP